MVPRYSASGKFSIGDIQSLGCSASAMFRVGDIQPLRYSASGTPWVGAVIFRFENIQPLRLTCASHGFGPSSASLLNTCGHTPWNSAPLQGSGPPGPCRHRPAQPQGSGPPRSMSASLLKRCGPRPLNHTSPSSGHPTAPPKYIPKKLKDLVPCNSDMCASPTSCYFPASDTLQCVLSSQGPMSGCPNL